MVLKGGIKGYGISIHTVNFNVSKRLVSDRYIWLPKTEHGYTSVYVAIDKLILFF